MADGPANTEGGGNGEDGTEMREFNPETLGGGVAKAWRMTTLRRSHACVMWDKGLD